ncbi:MAG: hypothetical protein ACRDHM_03310, partial [Actinomycetota bacterium]
MRRRFALGLLLLALPLAAGCGGGGEALDAPGVEGTIELLGPDEDGGGLIPTFEWAPVESAAEYRLALQDSQGVGVWAWQGTE